MFQQGAPGIKRINRVTSKKMGHRGNVKPKQGLLLTPLSSFKERGGGVDWS